MNRFDSQALINLTWSHSTDGLIIFEWDEGRQDLRVLKINPVAQDLTFGALQEGAFLCEQLPVHLEPNESVGMPLIDYYRSVIDSGKGESAIFYVGESQVRGWWQNNAVPLLDGATKCLFMSFRNVSPLVEAQHRFKQMASIDTLTGIPNRRAYDEFIAELCNDGTDFWLAYLDLDGFKAANDNYGHSFGDDLLIETARRLQSEDHPVYRLGGDEFAILMVGCFNPEECASRLCENISALFRGYQPKGSMGLVHFEGASYDSPDRLMADADEAMYWAKNNDAPYKVIGDRSTTIAALHGEFEAELANPIHLSLHYQPIFKLGTMEVASFEALIRWNRPQGYVDPGRILQIVHRHRLQERFALWGIDQAEQQYAEWGYPEGLLIGVNISPSWVAQQSIVAALSTSRGVGVEFTEDALIDNIGVVDQLRDHSIMVFLDDFGTGYSPIVQLGQISADKIKLDYDIVANPELLKGTAALIKAAAKGALIVAEGIDSSDKLERARAAGVEYGQGYFLGKPVPGSEVAIS